jgi:hypothetical protein
MLVTVRSELEIQEETVEEISSDKKSRKKHNETLYNGDTFMVRDRDIHLSV